MAITNFGNFANARALLRRTPQPQEVVTVAAEVVTKRAEVVTKTGEVVTKNAEVVNMISANH